MYCSPQEHHWQAAATGMLCFPTNCGLSALHKSSESKASLMKMKSVESGSAWEMFAVFDDPEYHQASQVGNELSMCSIAKLDFGATFYGNRELCKPVHHVPLSACADIVSFPGRSDPTCSGEAALPDSRRA